MFKVHTEPEGDPRLAILDAAEKWPADLIVMGSHGRSEHRSTARRRTRTPRLQLRLL
jgi:nucleotide-binding universal stress UspA family protein